MEFASQIFNFTMGKRIYWHIDNNTALNKTDIDDKEKCDLLGAFSFFMQIILGGLAFSVLIGKILFIIS